METVVLSSAVSRSCLEGFIDLCKSLKGLSDDHRFSKQISLVDTEDELGRFRVWAGNIGALQAGHSSLEYRLREASLVLQNVLKLLGELKALLQEITLVTSGIRLPYDEQIVQDGSDSDDEFDFGEIETDQDEAPKTELQRNYLSIVDIIDNLYKLSIYIRNSTSRNRFSKAASFQVVDPDSGVDLLGRYQDFDIEHVRHLFQDLPREYFPDVRYQQNELIERLGKAITRRRQLFMYWKRHRDKLSAKLSAKTDPVKDYKIEPSQAANMATLGAHLNGNSPAPNKAQSEKTKSAFTATTATLFVHRDENPDDLQSMISSVTTARGLDGGRASLPPPPKVSSGKDFECPYCFTICPAKYLNERNWRVHLLKDLQPYVCTYARCKTGSQLYSSRHEWMSHEIHAHQKKWRCPAHPQVEYASRKDYAKHLEKEHEQATGSSNLPTMLDIGETTSNDTPRVCPLCLVEEGSSDRFYNHIAFHLERIAAFSLPRNTAGPEDDMESVRTASTNANRGSHGSESFETLSAFEEEPQRLSEVGEEAVSLILQMVYICVKGYQVISEARGIPEDAKYFQGRLKIEEHRLTNWAKVVELTQERNLSSSVNKDLAREVLHRKEELLSRFVKLEMQSSTELTAINDVKDNDEDKLSLLVKSPRLATETGRRFPDTVRWATFNEQKLYDLIKELSSLNDYLVELFTDQQQNKLDAVEIKTSTEIRESNSKIETLLNNMGARLEVDQTLREPGPQKPREFHTTNLKLEDGGGDDIQSLGQTSGLIEYGANPVYATGFEKDQIPGLPANTDETASDEEALPHQAPTQHVKFSASSEIVADVEYHEVVSDIGSMPPDDHQPMGPDEFGPSIASESVSSPRITLQSPRDSSALKTPFLNAVLQQNEIPPPNEASCLAQQNSIDYLNEPGASNEFKESIENMWIAVMGATGAGKSSFIEQCTDQKVTIGVDLISCTATVEEYTFTVRNTNVHLVEIPGFDDINRKDIDVLRDISTWLGKSFQANIRLSGIIYLHRISDQRMLGSAKRNLHLFKKLIGENCFSQVVLATTMWENVDPSDGIRREYELESTEDFWGFMRERGSQVVRHEKNNRQSAMKVLDHFLNYKDAKMVLAIQDDMINRGLDLHETGVGQLMTEEIILLQEKHREELKQLEIEIQEANDQESIASIQNLQKAYEQKIEEARKDRESIRDKIEWETLRSQADSDIAARYAHETTAGALIMASDVNQQNSYGRTPLIEATRNGADKIVKLLLGNGADVNSKDKEGKTALHEAVNNGHVLIFDMLLAAGADIESKNSFGFTPLHYVFNHKETTIARMLLEKGADVNARTTNGETPLHLVAGVPKQHRLVKLFLREGADPNLVSHPFGLDGYERQSPLRTACSILGNVETVRLLIGGGADINADTVRTGTALQAACKSGDIDIVSLLIEMGASVDAPRPLAPSPLQEAARNGHLEIVQLLLNKDADIDAQSDVLGTALEAACCGDHRIIAELLIRKGASLTSRDAFGQRDKYGRTCVDLAIAEDDIDFAKFLVKTIQDTLGFEHRETLAAEEKLKSALESRDDIEGCSSEFQQRNSHDSGDSDNGSGLIFPRDRTQSSKERVHEDTNTLSIVVLQAREKLLQAMKRPEDRSLLLHHENRILRFINSVESMGDSIDEGPRNSYSQTLIETLARYYGLNPIVSRADGHLKLYRGDETIRPARLWMLESLRSTSSVVELPPPSETGIESEESSSDGVAKLERPRSPNYGQTRFSDGRDAKLVEAMNNENDRSFLLRIERRIIDFVEQEKDGYVDFPRYKASNRILIRRLAEYYGLSYFLVNEPYCVRLQRISDARLRLPIPLSQLDISLPSGQDPKESEMRRNSTGRLDTRVEVRGILKPPKDKFPETADALREGVAPSNESDGLKGIPPGARWTKIDRKLVSPTALEEARERFEERMDHVIVLRALNREEISELAERTKEIREDKKRGDAASEDGSTSSIETRPARKRD